MIAGEGCPP